MVFICAKDELSQIEEILFALELEFEPSLLSFNIICGENIFKYRFEKILNKYRIITV